MSPEASHPIPSEHRFAWDGFEFCGPSDWDLSFYDFSNSSARVVRRDDVGHGNRVSMVQPAPTRW